MELKYKTLDDLQTAYLDGSLDRAEHPLVIDNDQSSVYVGDLCVYRGGGPRDIAEEALKMLFIPYDNA